MNIADKIKNSVFGNLINIKLLPTAIMLLLILAYWIAFYDNSLSLGIYLLTILLSLIGAIAAVFLLLARKFKLCLSILAPILLTGLIGPLPLDIVLAKDAWPVRNKLIHARHYIEYVVQRNVVHPEMKKMADNSSYQEWEIEGQPAGDYKIIFDPTDQIVNEHGKSKGGCDMFVYRLDKHFYMQAHLCP